MAKTEQTNLLFPQARDAVIEIVKIIDSIQQLAKSFSPTHGEQQLISLVERLADVIEESGHPLAQVENKLAGPYNGLPQCHAGQSEASYHELAFVIGVDVYFRAWAAGDARAYLEHGFTSGGFRRFNTELLSRCPGGSSGAISHMTSGLGEFDAEWLVSRIEDEAKQAMVATGDTFIDMAAKLHKAAKEMTKEESVLKRRSDHERQWRIDNTPYNPQRDGKKMREAYVAENPDDPVTDDPVAFQNARREHPL